MLDSTSETPRMRQTGAERVSGASAGYTAADIRILDPAEQSERFSWVRAAALAGEYPWVPRACFERLLVACELSGQDEAAAVRRYALGTREVMTPEFYAVYADLVAEQRWR